MRELDEFEQTAQRCQIAAQDVESALRDSEFGWILTGFRAFLRVGPALAASEARSAEAATAVTQEQAPTSSPGKIPAIALSAGPAAQFPTAAAAFAPPQTLDQVAALRDMITKLRKLLTTPNHPIVSAAQRAGEMLEHVRVRVLPQIEVLSNKKYNDYDLRDCRRAIADATDPMWDADNFLWILLMNAFKTLGWSLADHDILHFTDLASPVARGIGAALHALPTASRSLLALVQRERMLLAFDRAAAPPLPGPPTAKQETSPMEQGMSLDVDFAILTVIDIEREAVLRAFGLGQKDRVKRDGRVYWRGTVPLPGGRCYKIIVAQPIDMANVDTALLAADVIRHWEPGAALLVGIAAKTGKARKVKLGDVVIGTEVYYYERGKATPEGIEPEPKMLPADPALLSTARSLSDWDFGLSLPRPDESNDVPSVHYGVIASGEKVVADATLRDHIAASHRKTLAIEMEGYGFSRAVWHTMSQVRPLVIRGICDDATSAKDDHWHEYAAAAAAGAAKYLLLDEPLPSKGRAAVQSNSEEALCSLRDQGRLPQLKVSCQSRTGGNGPGKVILDMEIRNVGACDAYGVKSAIGDAPLSLRANVLSRHATASFVWELNVPPKEHVARLRIRFANDVGDLIEDVREMMVAPPGISDIGVNVRPVSLQHLGKQPLVDD
jgi:nucleoside phosphorylase